MREIERSSQHGTGLGSPTRGRINTTSLGVVSPEDMAVQGLYLRAVSVVEATLDALALELTKVALKRVDAVISNLILEKEIAGSSSWEARRRMFRRHHGIDLRSCVSWREIEAAVDVRNAIAHGLGKLTARQLASREVFARLAHLGIDVVDNRVHVERSAITDLIRFCGEFIEDVDARAS